MKRIIYISMSVLQVLLALGAYLVHSFSVKRMGMMRHVMFTNQQWESSFPIGTIKHLFIILSVIVVVIILYFEFKSKSLKKERTYRFLETFIISLVLIGVILMFTTEAFIAYYFVSLIFVVILIIQYLKHLVSLVNDKKGSL